MAVEHPVFDRLERTYRLARHFRFLRAPADALADPDDGRRGDLGTRDHPGYAVRRQTRHFSL
eukprot:1441355-Prymnesium_polylepis.1